MGILSEDYRDSVCEIKNLRNDLLTVGRIYAIGDEDIEFANFEDDKMPILPYKSPVKVYIFNNRVGFKILLGTVFISTDAFMRITNIRSVQDQERRGYFRLNVKTLTNIYEIDPETETVDIDPYGVLLEDISLSGLQISIDKPMKMGTKIAVEVCLIKRKLLFSCEVVRQAPSDDDRYHYGCLFYNQSERQIDDLCYDLFQLQRTEMRKRSQRR